MKKLFVVSLVLVLALGSVFAQGASESSKKLTVGICQLVQHPATQGFKDALIEGIGAENVNIDEQNASGEPAN